MAAALALKDWGHRLATAAVRSTAEGSRAAGGKSVHPVEDGGIMHAALKRYIGELRDPGPGPITESTASSRYSAQSPAGGSGGSPLDPAFEGQHAELIDPPMASRDGWMVPSDRPSLAPLRFCIGARDLSYGDGYGLNRKVALRTDALGDIGGLHGLSASDPGPYRGLP